MSDLHLSTDKTNRFCWYPMFLWSSWCASFVSSEIMICEHLQANEVSRVLQYGTEATYITWRLTNALPLHLQRLLRVNWTKCSNECGDFCIKTIRRNTGATSKVEVIALVNSHSVDYWLSILRKFCSILCYHSQTSSQKKLRKCQKNSKCYLMLIIKIVVFH